MANRELRGWGGCRWHQAKAPAHPVAPHTEGNPQQGPGQQAGGNGRPLGRSPGPSGSDCPMASGELGVGGSRGQGQLQAAREDGPDGRPGLGTVPAREFHAPGL